MRHISPELVKLIDEKLEPLDNPTALLRETLKCLRGVHEEGGNNKGKIVELFQATVGKPCAQAWCMDFVQSAIAYVEAKLGMLCPLPATEGTLFMADWARQNGKLHQYMLSDSLVIWKHLHGEGGHVGYVLKAGDTLDTIEGNTGPGPGVEREGDGVYEKTRNPHANGDMVVLGFVPVSFVPAPGAKKEEALAAATAGGEPSSQEGDEESTETEKFKHELHEPRG